MDCVVGGGVRVWEAEGWMRLMIRGDVWQCSPSKDSPPHGVRDLAWITQIQLLYQKEQEGELVDAGWRYEAPND